MDCTVGAGGHARGIGERLGPAGHLIGIDRDPSALAAAARRLAVLDCRVTLVRSSFAELGRILAGAGIDGVDGVLFDLGVSSPQLDDPERGFSYHEDAPLDMRMDPAQALTAYHIVNSFDESELSRIIREYGEERWASRIAQFIIQRRSRQPIETTGDLVAVIKAAIPAAARRQGPHPARRTFQALRIAVNDELAVLERALEQAVEAIRPGGRIAVISFHSLEDRAVKEAFRRYSGQCLCPRGTPVCVCNPRRLLRVITRKPVMPAEDEVRRNPRSRSARLRVAERTTF